MKTFGEVHHYGGIELPEIADCADPTSLHEMSVDVTKRLMHTHVGHQFLKIADVVNSTLRVVAGIRPDR